MNRLERLPVEKATVRVAFSTTDCSTTQRAVMQTTAGACEPVSGAAVGVVAEAGFAVFDLAGADAFERSKRAARVRG